MSLAHALWIDRTEAGSSRPWRMVAVVALAAITLPAMLLKPLLGLAALAAFAVSTILLAWPALPTLLVIFVVYSNAAAVAVHFHGVPFIVGAVVPLALALPLAHSYVIRREKLILDPLLFWVFLLLLVQVVSSLFSRDPMRSLGTARDTLIEGLLLCFLIQNVVRTPKAVRRVTWTLIAAGGLLAALTCFQHFTGTYSNNYGGFAQLTREEFLPTGEPQRLAGPIGDPNRYAQILLMIFPLAFFCYLGKRLPLPRILAIAAAVLVVLAIAITQSRGAALGLVCVLAVMALLRYVKLYQCAIVVVVAAVMLLSMPGFIERLSALERLSGVVESGSSGIAEADGSARSRFTQAVAAAMIFIEHPVLGVGADMYPLYYHEYAKRVEGGTVKKSFRRPHTLYLGMAAELGAVGVGAFLMAVVRVLRGLVRARRLALATRPDLALLATGYLLALVSYLCTAMFLHFGYVRYFWLILALGSVVVRIAEEYCDPRNGLVAGSALHTGGLS